MPVRRLLLVALLAASPALANYGPPTLATPPQLPFILLSDYFVDLAFLLLGLLLVRQSGRFGMMELLKLGGGVLLVGAVADALATALTDAIIRPASVWIERWRPAIGGPPYVPLHAWVTGAGDTIFGFALITSGDTCLLRRLGHLERRTALKVALVIALGTTPYLYAILSSIDSRWMGDTLHLYRAHWGRLPYDDLPIWLFIAATAVAMAVSVGLLAGRVPNARQAPWIARALILAVLIGAATMWPWRAYELARHRGYASEANLKRVAIGLFAYRQARQAFPRSLEGLVPEYLAAERLHDPADRRPGSQPSYEYRRPADDLSPYDQVPVVVFDAYPHPTHGVAVYSDGTVRAYDRRTGPLPESYSPSSHERERVGR